MFIHQLTDVKDLFEVLADERGLPPSIIEKDYWLMHCLWGIQEAGYKFELKGGTSLSKGFSIIERFSEDIDIQIHPENDLVKIGKNQDKPAHIKSRKDFFDNIANTLQVDGLAFERDYSFDDPSEKMRSAGIKGIYQSLFLKDNALKEGIILELGFDQTTPNIACDITSWAYDKLKMQAIDVTDNRAKNVLCYLPEYTFVEKLQTISTKFRRQQKDEKMPINFLRHYYDVYKLLENERVRSFIGSKEYIAHKQLRFRNDDEIKIKNNLAFSLDETTKNLYSNEFSRKSSIYFGIQPTFDEIIARIQQHIEKL